jgi:ribosome-binding protein aMBF1 (putative translation factor)
MRPDQMKLKANPMCEHARIPARRNIHDCPQSVAVDARRGESGGEEIDIGDVIRANLLKLRRERGLSLGELAELSRTSLSTLEDLASGRTFPNIELLWKLAQALNLPCTAFIEEQAIASLPSAQRAIGSTYS